MCDIWRFSSIFPPTLLKIKVLNRFVTPMHRRTIFSSTKNHSVKGSLKKPSLSYLFIWIWRNTVKNYRDFNGKKKFTGKNRKVTFPEFPALHFKFCLNLMFFLWNNCFFLVFSYQLCLLWLCVTFNVIKLMFIAYFSLMSLTMMVISVCVNDAPSIYVII